MTDLFNGKFILITAGIIVVSLIFLVVFFFFRFPAVGAGGQPPLPTVGIKIDGFDLKAEVAADTYSVTSGLSNRPGLAENEGMIFVFQNKSRPSFWMKDMKFALDFIWLDGDRVADLTLNAPPPKTWTDVLAIYRPKIQINRVLEIPAGFITRHNIKIGDTATFDRNL